MNELMDLLDRKMPRNYRLIMWRPLHQHFIVCTFTRINDGLGCDIVITQELADNVADLGMVADYIIDEANNKFARG